MKRLLTLAAAASLLSISVCAEETAPAEGTPPTTAEAAPAAPSLESQLSELQGPANQAPAGVTKEKLYVVQSRYNPLKGRFGMSLGFARNFTGSSYLNM